MINRTSAPKIIDAVDFSLELKPCALPILDNGVPVYAVNAGAEEVMMVELVFFAGNCYEDKNLVAATTNYLLKNGTATKTAFQINEHFEYYGSYLNRSCYNETSTITLHSLSKHLKELLPVMREIITECTFPQEELDIYKQNMKQRLNVNLKKGDFVATRLIDAYLYGEQHPYGRYSRFEDFDTINRESIQQFYKEYYQNGKLLIFVAGKLPKNIFELLDANFGDLQNSPIALADIPAKPAAERKYRVINDPNGVQGAIRMG